jgi:GxxExxY protein
MNADERRYNELTERVIGCIYAVSNAMGCGFLEKVYRNALHVELTVNGLVAEPEKKIIITYRGAVVGDYIADLVVEGCILLELKAVKALDDVHMAQCLNYLKATGIKVCLLVNFAKPKVEIRRIVNHF